jgi:uncharacterized protein YndB with AHSA1/START domain
MSERSIEHGSFTVERVYDASPARVFAAWSDPQAKASWFDGPDSDGSPPIVEADFSVGGRERRQGALADGRGYAFDAVYCDIVADNRIVYSYAMLLDGIRISVSLATVELRPEGGGTRLIYTEQGAFFDGYEVPGQREFGMGGLLDSLGEWLEGG